MLMGIDLWEFTKMVWKKVKVPYTTGMEHFTKEISIKIDPMDLASWNTQQLQYTKAHLKMDLNTETVKSLFNSGRMNSLEGVYNGSWSNDDKNGQGTMRYSNQDTY